PELMDPPPPPPRGQQRRLSVRRSVSAPKPQTSVLQPSNLQNQPNLDESISASGTPAKQPCRRSTRMSAANASISISHILSHDFNRLSLNPTGRRSQQRTPRKPPPLKCPLPPSPELTPPPVPPMPPKSTVGASDTPRRSVARKTPGFYAEQPTSPRPLHQAATDLDDDPDVDEDFEPSESSDEDDDEDVDEGSDDSEDSDETDDDIDGEEDLDDLEDDVASVDSMDVTLAGDLLARDGSPCGKSRQAGRRMSRASPLPASPLLRDSDIRLPNRRGAGNRRSTAPIDEARQRLQAREAPRILPCRHDEFQAVFSFVESRLRQEGGCGGCLFISGVPGTGKTATVMEVLRQVADMPDLPPFDTVLVNGMKVTEPKRVYSAIVRQLHKVRAPWQAALRRLKSEFNSARGRPCVLLVDELDMLCNRRQDVLYNLFEWPQNPNSRLIVLAIANTMDLPERVLVHRVASRLGLSRLVFQAYSHDQLMEIVRSRISKLHIFEDKAVEMAARKVAAVSGDARRALDLCSRSCDLAEQEFGPQQMQRMNLQVGMKHVNAAIAEMFAGPVITAVANQLSEYERLTLRACLSQRLESGRDENPVGRVWRSVLNIARSEGLEAPSWPALCVCLGCLHAMRLLLWDGGHRGLAGRVIINCSPQDVQLGLGELKQTPKPTAEQQLPRLAD
ncbi:hypothetical protein BOX15_Mlig011148g7, partial [Macrostomum lignano]